MSDWKLHTPTGTNDILPGECAVKKQIESTILRVMTTAGYKEVETPAFEYYDCYIGEGGMISQEALFKFFDEQGRILALRPDFTTSIARMAATKEANAKLPLRYLYTGNVYRHENLEETRQREFAQTGIELIGSTSHLADAEVISCAIEAIIALGIEDFSIEIGQVAFFNGIVEQAGFDTELTEKIRERIDTKDSMGIKLLIKDKDIDESLKKLIIDLPYLFGNDDIISRADIAGLNETSRAALDNLKKIYDVLCLYGFEKYISLDLGMLQSIDYYTGSIFKGYTYGIGFPICAGGRYDNLVSKFGEARSAVGVAMGINRLMAALKGKISNESIGSTLIFAEENAEGVAYEIASNLRTNDCLVEMYINDSDFDNAMEYAKETKQECIMRAYPDGVLKLYDLLQDNVVETTADDFLGYAEDEFTETPEDLGFRRF